MFGGIVYGLVGLVPTVAAFWKFLLTLVLFNLTTASVVLWLSIAFASVSVASLVGTLVMLFKCVFWDTLIATESHRLFSFLPFQPPFHWPFDQSRECHPCFEMALYRFVLPCRIRGAGCERVEIFAVEGNQGSLFFINQKPWHD
jgi:ABC-type transport system involved in multi-copper enzyme maturation permease subunit